VGRQQRGAAAVPPTHEHLGRHVHAGAGLPRQRVHRLQLVLAQLLQVLVAHHAGVARHRHLGGEAALAGVAAVQLAQAALRSRRPPAARRAAAVHLRVRGVDDDTAFDGAAGAGLEEIIGEKALPRTRTCELPLVPSLPASEGRSELAPLLWPSACRARRSSSRPSAERPLAKCAAQAKEPGCCSARGHHSRRAMPYAQAPDQAGREPPPSHPSHPLTSHPSPGSSPSPPPP
jgi:hypothetical protein